MSIDTIGNFLTIIRNGFMLGKSSVTAPYSGFAFEIAKVLKQEGFIKDVHVINQDVVSKKSIKVMLKYFQGESVIHEITRKSKPGRRYYAKGKNLKPVVGNFGISILTTNIGIITDKQARALSVGGEVICTVW
jgi:small subunit ribosomal protein S8